MRLPDRQIEIADRRRIGGDDMDIDTQPVGMKAERIDHALQSVKRVKRGLGMKHGAIARIEAALALVQHQIDVGLFDAVPGDIDEIGRASCRERVCQDVKISWVAVSLKKTENNKTDNESQKQI